MYFCRSVQVALPGKSSSKRARAHAKLFREAGRSHGVRQRNESPEKSLSRGHGLSVDASWERPAAIYGLNRCRVRAMHALKL